MSIIHFINSHIDRPGNIGVRTGHIIKNLKQIQFHAVCRGTKTFRKNANYYSMGFFGHFPRILNGIRIFLLHRYNHRIHDIMFFEFFCHLFLKNILKKNQFKIAHVWDYCPKLIRNLKKNGLKVIIDVPIAPSTYIEGLHSQNKALFLDFDPRMKDLEIESFSLADKIIAPSNFVANEIIRSGITKKKILVIPFGSNINTHKMEPNRKKIIKEINFCFLGAINGRKGIYDILDLWSDKEFVDDKLHLCGEYIP